MPDTVGGHWGTKQFARDLPLPVVNASYANSTFGDDLGMIPPPHLAGETLLFVIALRFDPDAVLVSRPSDLVEVCHFSNNATVDPHDATQIFVFRRDVVTPDYTLMHFVKTGAPTSFINGSIHAVAGCGPIENIVQSVEPYPKTIPAITTTKPNCLLVLGYTARYGLNQFIPAPPAAPVWEGIGMSYITVHWNAYQRDALVEGVYGPTEIEPLDPIDTYLDQFVVMQVSPKPAPPTPDLTITALSPSTGVIAGGTTVTVTGTSFALGATSVTIGATTIPAGSVTVISGTQLTFVTPAGPGGVISVQAVSVTVGAYESNELSFTYNAAGGFSPASPPNLQCWLDTSEASTVSLSGSFVTQWRDLSINRYVFNPPSDSFRPTYTDDIGGLDVMTWDSDRLTSTVAMPGERPRTFCWVMDPGSGQQGLFNTNGGVVIEITATGTLRINAGVSVDTGVAVTGLHVWTVQFNATHSQVWRDGISVWTGDAGSQLLPGSLNIGTDGFGGTPFAGYLPEIVTYPEVLSGTDRSNLEGYLTAKWTGGPYAPGAPVLNSATAGNAQVTLAWTPTTTGGSAITGYAVEKSPDGTSSWTAAGTPTASPHTVTGLTNGTIQYFRVKAVNAVGTGAASNVMSATPFAVTVPGAPTALDAVAGNAQAVLTWTAPASDGGAAITDYVVQWRTTAGPGSWTTFSDAVSATTGATVTGLTNGTSYDFQVAAVNSVGTGAYSATDTATPTGGGGGGGTPTVRSWAASTSLTVDKPAGTVAGDLLLLLVFKDGGGGNLANLTPPSGFTTADEVSVAFSHEGGVYWKVAGGSEPSTYTFTSVEGFSQSRQIMVALQDAHATAPVNAIGQAGGAGTVTITAPSITPSVDACLGLFFFAKFAFEVTGWTMVTSGWSTPQGVGAPAGCNSGFSTKTLGTGASGTVTVTANGTGTDYPHALGYQMAIRGA